MTILYPVSGMMMSGGGGHGVPIFALSLIPANHDAVTDKIIPLNEAISSIGHTLHESLTFVLIALIVVHAVGALKHHFIDKDQTIKRMFFYKSE